MTTNHNPAPAPGDHDSQLEELNPKWQYFKTSDGRYLVYSATVLDLIAQARQEERAQGLETFLTEVYGPRCKSKDTDDFPELKEGGDRCPTCAIWEHYDEWQAERRMKP